MAESDWTELTGGLGVPSVARGVTTGSGVPPGGGSFTFAFNSLTAASGAVGFFANQVGFAPMAEGGQINGVLRRGSSGGNTGWTPMLFIGLQGTAVTDSGYLIGLTDGDPAHLSVKKGTVDGGIEDLDPDPVANGILLKSTATFAIDAWVHVRLDMIVNDNGDVLLQPFTNDLDTNPLGGSPVWTTPAGMEGPLSPAISGFIDDVAQINTGSAPFTSGRGGFAFEVSDVTRRAMIDHVQVLRQT